MSEAPVLLSEDRNGTRILTMNRPDKMNAMNAALIGSIVDAVDTAHEDDSIGVVILAGGERAFSAGADLKEAATRKDHSAVEARRHAEAGSAIYEFAARTDKPVIAACRGYVLGGGCHLAISCDMVVAGEGALFGYPEVKRGLAATMVAPGLVHRIGPKAAFELLVMAENISAEQALALGMINRVVPDEDVLTTALGIADVFNGYDRAAVTSTKRVFLKSTELNLPQSLDAAREAMLYMGQLGDKD